MTGHFVVFEGIEGSGKTTQAHMLAAWLEHNHIPFRLTREPGGTKVGEQIRTVLLHGGNLSAEAELLLMLAARAAHVQEVVVPALDRGEIVVSDRYELSSLAYQGAGRELGVERVRAMNAFATGGLSPNLTFLLDVPSAVADRRRAEGRASEDRIEGAGEAFHTRVAEAYRLLATSDPAVMRIDGTLEPRAVHTTILHQLQARFPETLASKPG